MGRLISALGERLAAKPEAERPEHVIVAIFTDGLENASKEFTQGKVAEMVKTQQEQFNWKFLFSGANQDAVLTAKGYNIPKHGTMTFAATSAGVMANNAALGRATSALRYGKKYFYSDEEREAALQK